MRYRIEYYKNGNYCGCKRKFDNNQQVFAFGGKSCGWTEAQLRTLGDTVMQKLDSGTAENDVAKWAKKQVADDKKI